MMIDTAWAVTSAPMMTGFGNVGFSDSVINGIADDDIEGMIDDLGFFQDKDDSYSCHPLNEINKNERTFKTIVDNKANNAFTIPKYAKVSPARSPITTTNDNDNDNDTGAAVVTLTVTVSDTDLDVSNSGVTDTVNNNNTKNCGVALPQPPQLLTARQSPVSCTTTDNKNNTIQNVINQQRATILQNQKIIEAQMNELHGNNHQICQPLPATSMHSSNTNKPTTKSFASYPLARAALKKADEQIIDGTKKDKGTKRKTPSPSNSTSTEANAYQKWKLTPAGATKLRAVDSGGISSCRNMNKHQEDAPGKILTPDELELRRERNRKHAKKSRLRKKSLTSTLEQSLELLREENTRLRKHVEEHFVKKSDDSTTAAMKSVESLLEEHRLRSHEQFIECILTDNRDSLKRNDSNDSDGKDLYSGRGIALDDKTHKVLKGLSKPIALGTSKQ